MSPGLRPLSPRSAATRANASLAHWPNVGGSDHAKPAIWNTQARPVQARSLHQPRREPCNSSPGCSGRSKVLRPGWPLSPAVQGLESRRRQGTEHPGMDSQSLCSVNLRGSLQHLYGNEAVSLAARSYLARKRKERRARRLSCIYYMGLAIVAGLTLGLMARILGV